MKVDFTQVFMQLMEPTKLLLDGPEPPPGEKDERNPITLLSVVCNALMLMDPQKPMGGKEKIERYGLAMRVVEAEVDKDAEFTVTEVALMKKLVEDNPQYTPLLVGQADKMLEPGDTNEEKVAGAIEAEEIAEIAEEAESK